ncbi:class A beta-lactamase-related serine hydrolase [Paenarthrobacter sp. OM7]|uniref:class A beta-lactamase-related serine hydrolase n=1 Tax=Paenarthrobacter sp. OM7 TaxID=3041264 RepID=UPI0024686004|nr:class A beta-lactamase-related serine hydrolase [Paenarthrobacter sp. OM7]WGM20445.1 class A beta-lactamase-related serine hydrolase [Paenarthrobacter sp. OM7]
MDSIISDYSDGIPTVSSCLIDPHGRIVAERDAEKVFYSASTIKLGVLIAAMQLVDSGQLNLDQPMVSTQTFVSGIEGAGPYTFDPEEVDPGMAPLGETMPLREVLKRMIVVSSNEATNMVAQLIGIETVTAAFASCGTRNTSMGRLFGDYAALNEGLTITTTALDLARTMHAVTSGRAAGPESTRLMIEFLEQQDDRVIGAVVAELQPGARWGSKSGSVTGIYHDVAFIVRGRDAADAHSLAICTRAFHEPQGRESIQAVASGMLQVTDVLRSTARRPTPL